MKYPTSCREDQRLSTEGKIVSKYCNISKNSRGEGGGPSTLPPPRTSVRPNQICVVSFLYSYKDDLLSKIWAKLNQCQRMKKVDVRLTCVAQKRSLLKFRNVDRRPPLQRGSRCFDTVFWRPSQYFSIALKVICCMLEFK